MPAVPALIGAAGAIGGGLIAAGGAKSAAKTAAGSAAEANALQRYQYDQTRADQQPWRDVGVQGLNLLGQGFGMSPVGGAATGPQPDWNAYLSANPDLMAEAQRYVASGQIKSPEEFAKSHYETFGKTEGRQLPTLAPTGGQAGSQVPNFLDTFSADDFRADPGYQFRLTEGMNAVQGSAAAGGSLHSGGALKALTRYAQGTADQTYNDAYNRFNNDRTNIFNRLSGLAGLGQTANQQVGQAGQNYANNAGNNLMAAGAARAGAQASNGAMWGNTVAGIGGMAANYFGPRGITPFEPQTATAPGFGGGYAEKAPVQTYYPDLQRPPSVSF